MYSIDFPSEKVIEDYLFSEIARANRCPLSEKEVSICLRQFDIPGYGITDLICIEIVPHFVTVTVIELKNEYMKESHLSQLKRYMRGLERFLSRYRLLGDKNNWGYCVDGILAGPFQPGKNDLVYLLDGMEDISVYKLDLSFEHGFTSELIGNEGWYSPRENFSSFRPIVKRVFDGIASVSTDLQAMQEPA